MPAIGITEQADIIRGRAVDGEIADGVIESIEGAGEDVGGIVGVITNGVEACAGIPVGRSGSVDVVGQRVALTHHAAAAHALHAVDVGKLVGGAAGAVATERADEAAAGNTEIVGAETRQVAGYLAPDTGLQIEGADVDRRRGGNAVDRRERETAIGTGDRRVDGDVVVGVQREGAGAGPGDGADHGDVAGVRAAAAGSLRDVRSAIKAGNDSAGCCGIDDDVGRINQPVLRLDHCPALQADAVSAGFDEAAVAALSRSIQGTAHVDDAVVHVGEQLDGAAAGVDAARFDHALVIDHRLNQAVRCLGGHQHGAAVGADELLVFGQGVDRALIDLQVDEAVAGEVQRDVAAGGEADVAELGDQRALVAHLAAEQGDVAVIGGGDIALVDEAAGGAGEAVVAAHEIGVGEVQGGGDQAADIDLGGLAKEDAIGVKQEDLAVGVEVAVDLGLVGADNPVEGNGGTARLDKIDRGVGTDVETLPVDGELLAGLVNGQGGAGTGDGAAAGGDHAAGGQDIGFQGLSIWDGKGEDGGGQGRGLAATSLAVGLGSFRDSDPGVEGGVEDRAVCMVHGESLEALDCL